MIDPSSVLRKIHNHSNETIGSLLFIPMIPSDNYSQSINSDNHIIKNEKDSNIPSFIGVNDASLAILLKMPSIPFLSNMAFNDSLKKFLSSYLSYRQRPYDQQIRLSNYGEPRESPNDLHNMDKRVIYVFYRLFHDDFEMPLSTYLPTTGIQVAGHSNTSRALVFTYEDYCSVLSFMTELSFPYHMDLLALIGNSNASSSIIIKAFEAKPSMRKELISSVKETSKVIKQLLSPNGKSKSSSSKIQSTSQKMVSKSQKHQPQPDELMNLTAEESFSFIGDIVMSWASVIIASSKAMLQETSRMVKSNPLNALLCGNMTGLSLSGKEFLGIIATIYDTLLHRVVKEFNDQTKQSSNFDNSNIKAVDFIRKTILMTLNELIKVSISNLEILPRAELDMLMMSDWTMEGNCSWIEWVQETLTNDSPNGFSQSGSLVADYLAIFEENFTRLLLLCTGGESDVSDSVLEPCRGLVGFVKSKAPESTPVTYTLSRSTSIKDPANKKQVATIDSSDESVSSIKSIFPEYGRAFILACLNTYGMDVEKTVDALMNDNLPPHLSRIDRSMELISLGKASFANTFAGEQNKEFLESQKARIRALEREEKENSRVIAEEYNDDYDDQYDDVLGVKVEVTGESDLLDQIRSEEKPIEFENKKTNKKNKDVAPKINWDVKMKDMKRLNNLIRAEESEEKFWSSMRNTNHDMPVYQHDKSETVSNLPIKELPNIKKAQKIDNRGASKSDIKQSVEAVSGKRVGQGALDTVNAAKAAAELMKQKQNKSGKESAPDSDGQSSKSGNPHYRTKHYDKHHQKDRALRKMGTGGI